MVIIVGIAPEVETGTSSMIWMVVQMIILFYVCELLIQNIKSRYNRFTASVALALIAYRGLS